MFVYRSNRSERLVDEVAQVLRRPLADPLAPEFVVVQSKGMERWLAMQLSERLRVCANAQFPFPRRMLERIFGCVLSERRREAPDADAFDEATLTWAIAALLPARLSEPVF